MNNAILNLDVTGVRKRDHRSLPVKLHRTDLIKKLLIANNTFDLIGTGSFGSVYSLRTETDRVLKICKVYESLKMDGYYNYLKVVLSRNSETNPFLPRIDRFLKYKSKDQFLVYVVKMERLIPMSYQTPDQTLKMGNDLIVNFATEPGFNPKEPAFSLSKTIKEIYLNDEIDLRIKNKDLQKALKGIRKIQFGKSKFWCDMGERNFMIRRQDGKNDQLVITDPLS
jgi:hypothetical protein